ncbi:MAG: lipoprotein signal peptidase [Saprospiraceae bacterium]
MKRSTLVILVVFLVLIIDQGSKFWVKTNMVYGAEFAIFGFEWAKIHFVENPGMAFGIQFGGEYGKLALSLFRVCAVGFLIYLIRQLIKEQVKPGLLVCFALILAGAIGNILDSAFYGLLFSESGYHHAATLLPAEGGYGTFLHGRVVDMLYFPMFEGYFPSWMPFWGNQNFLFFRPVFNIADAAISLGVFAMLAFYISFFKDGGPITQAVSSTKDPILQEGIAPSVDLTNPSTDEEAT